MIDEKFIIAAVILNFIGGGSYLIDTLKGKVKPNKVTWFIWAVAPLVAFVAEIKQGVGIQSLTTFMVGFGPLLIFFASFVNKKSQWKIGRLDIICGILSAGGLVLWYLTRVGNIAIFFSILADALAAIPTIVKGYHFPKTENYYGFLFAGIGSAITLLTIKTWDFAYFGFPLYIILLNTTLVSVIKFKLGKLIKR